MAGDAQSVCPVDHKTRDAWITQAREVEAQKAKAQAPPSACPVDHTAKPPPAKSWTETFKSYVWSSSAESTPQQQQQPARKSGLDSERVVSTIPRTTDPAACPVDHGDADARPANHEMESGVDPSGNWVYPSERMFFDAMKRKGYDARVADMKTVVPIHHAVNERVSVTRSLDAMDGETVASPETLAPPEVQRPRSNLDPSLPPVVNQLLYDGTSFVADYGWYLLGGIVLLLILRNLLMRYLKNRGGFDSNTLSKLDEERRALRAEQQRRWDEQSRAFYAAEAEKKKALEDEKKAKKFDENKKKALKNALTRDLPIYADGLPGYKPDRCDRRGPRGGGGG